MGGWDQLRARLIGTCERDEKTGAILWDTGAPMIYFFNTSTHIIRTLPALQHDEARPEDVDSEGEDHAPDETRYAGMSRPYVRGIDTPAPKPDFFIGTPEGTISSNLSIKEMIEKQTLRRKEREGA